MEYIFFCYGVIFVYFFIVVFGVNFCIFYYIENNLKMWENDLLLIDVGVVYNYYNFDIIWIFLISGKFILE